LFLEVLALFLGVLALGLGDGSGLAVILKVTVTWSFFGTFVGIVSSASVCGVAGSLVGSGETVQLVLLAQPTMNVGLTIVGVLSVAITVAVIVPFSLPAEAHAAMRKSTFLPACTVAEFGATLR
jgi:hypothetical protein